MSTCPASDVSQSLRGWELVTVACPYSFLVSNRSLNIWIVSYVPPCRAVMAIAHMESLRNLAHPGNHWISGVSLKKAVVLRVAGVRNSWSLDCCLPRWLRWHQVISISLATGQYLLDTSWMEEILHQLVDGESRYNPSICSVSYQQLHSSIQVVKNVQEPSLWNIFTMTVAT